MDRVLVPSLLDSPALLRPRLVSFPPVGARRARGGGGPGGGATRGRQGPFSAGEPPTWRGERRAGGARARLRHSSRRGGGWTERGGPEPWRRSRSRDALARPRDGGGGGGGGGWPRLRWRRGSRCSPLMKIWFGTSPAASAVTAAHRCSAQRGCAGDTAVFRGCGRTPRSGPLRPAAPTPLGDDDAQLRVAPAQTPPRSRWP